MSVKIMGEVWGLELTAAKLLVLLALADHADHEGSNIYPSVELVAWKCGYSESQTRRIIKSLVDDEILTREIRPGKTTLYSINLNKGKKKKPFQRKGLQNDTPSIAMTPQGMHSYDTPTPSIAMTPEPSLEPSDKPKESRARKNSKSNIEVQFRSDWDANHDKGEALLTAFGTDVKFQKPSELPRAALEPYLEAAKQLKDTSLEDIAALYKFVKNKARDCNWSGFGVMTLPKYYPEFLTHRRAAEQKMIEKIPPPLPTADPKEFIRRLTGQELVIAK